MRRQDGGDLHVALDAPEVCCSVASTGAAFCQGQRLLASVNDHRRDVFTRILRRMAAADRAALTQALSQFVAAADEYAERVTSSP